MTKVKLLKPYGWCNGVESAFKRMKQIENLHPNYKIYMMGGLVHNQNSLKLIKSKNIFFIESINQISFLKSIKNKNSVVVFPAHGYSLDA
jgi:4-hydroxy-3-methylbut-2-enyl diphosphate reductase IspH